MDEHRRMILITALAHCGGLLKRGNDRSYILHLITFLTRPVSEKELQLSESQLKDIVEEAENIVITETLHNMLEI